jgi:hypothetical protein|tara:strand:- start:139 stop:453 length:315 start_codon:yes stop_codon:yes gene_type:complete
MDINHCIDHLGLNRNTYRLTQSNPPHEFISWDGPDPQPTQEELEAAWTQIQEVYNNDYSRKREAEYPSTDELIVALWEGVVEERMAAVTKLEAKRQAVKLKYPK